LESTTRKVGSNYQKSWNQLPEKLEASTRKFGSYPFSWLPLFLVARLYKRPHVVVAGKSVRIVQCQYALYSHSL